MKKLLPLILFFLVAPALNPALGQEKLSVTAIPPRLEIEALPGATLQETLKIRNESPVDQVFQVLVKDFIVTGNQGTPIPVNETVSRRWSLSSWIVPSPKQIPVPAGQTRTIDFLVSVPPNGLAGGHYAMITYSPVTAGTLNGTGAQINPQVGTLVYLKVIGDVTEAANLKTLTVDKFFKDYGPTAINAEIENLGDIHFQPEGKLMVTNWLNQTVFSQDLDPKNIFPFASRTYDFTVSGKWRLGRYAAKLDAVAGDSQQPVHGLIYFWIVPVKEISLAAGIVALIIILIILLKRKKKSTPLDNTPPAPGPSL